MRHFATARRTERLGLTHQPRQSGLIMQADKRTHQRSMLNKVPLVTLAFWVIKILATTVGETGADFLNFNLGFGLTTTSLLAAAVLAGFLWLQLRQDRYVPWIYW